MYALRVLGAAGTVARANFVRLPLPLKVNLCVTYACQYRCKTCNIWQRTPTGELTTDELLAFVDANRGIRWLDVTGGEIFLRKDMLTIFDAIVNSWDRLVVLHFPTNGFLTDPIVAAAARLSKAGPTSVVITVSLDGDERQNDEVRGIKGGFKRQIATFKALRRIRGIRVMFGMTLSRYTAGTYRATFDACQREIPDLRADEFHLNVAQTSNHYYGNAADDVAPRFETVLEDMTEYEKGLAASWTPSAFLERVFLRRMHDFQTTGMTPVPCHALRSSCFIDPSGSVYPCISYSAPLGNLRDTQMQLEPIWNDEGTRRMQREIWSGSCPQCWTACEAYQSLLGNAVRPYASGGNRRPSD